MGSLIECSLQRVALPGDLEIHFTEEGSGPPLVFVHGGMGDWTSWAPQWSAFTSCFRCISYSRRYSSPNRNAVNSRSHSVVDEAKDLAYLLRSWRADPAILVGTSYGAYTALQTALIAPDQVRAIAITEPPVLPFADEVPGGEAARLRFQHDVLEPAAEAFTRGDADAAVRLLTEGINGMGPGEAGTPEGRARRVRNAEAMRALCVSTDAYPALDRIALRAMKIPTLLTYGDRTEPVHRATTLALSRYLPHARLVEVVDCGHGVHRDNPSAFNVLLQGFLREVCQQADVAAVEHVRLG